MGQILITALHPSKYSLTITGVFNGADLPNRYLGKSTNMKGESIVNSDPALYYFKGGDYIQLTVTASSLDSGYALGYKYKEDGPIIKTVPMNGSILISPSTNNSYYFDVVKV